MKKTTADLVLRLAPREMGVAGCEDERHELTFPHLPSLSPGSDLPSPRLLHPPPPPSHRESAGG